MKRVLILLGVCALLLPAPGFVTAAASASLVTVGSPAGTTPQNHQNEPAVAMDAHTPSTLVAGVNDFIDWQPCPTTAPATTGSCRGSEHGVGLSGVYFSFDSGHDWIQPTYTGLTSRDRAEAGEWDVLVGQRVAGLLRQPHGRDREQLPADRAVQGGSLDRGLPPG